MAKQLKRRLHDRPRKRTHHPVEEMMANYMLEGHKPKKEPDVIKWAKWFEKTNRRVKESYIGEARVSTVFLGIDHQFIKGPPLLFETMVFGGVLDEEQDRCSTWEEAEKMHDAMVKRVKEKK